MPVIHEPPLKYDSINTEIRQLLHISESVETTSAALHYWSRDIAPRGHVKLSGAIKAPCFSLKSSRFQWAALNIACLFSENELISQISFGICTLKVQTGFATPCA